MNLLTAEKISKSFTDKILLKEVTLGINEGDRIGVIGINGTGKSTLLKLIAGLELPDEGTVTKGNKVRIEYLPQNPEFDKTKTILENVICNKKGQEEHWNIEGEARAMLLKLGIANADESVSVLSGGQKKRAALVRTLMTPADILVLDEPTNHLDNEMAEWLENYLNQWRGAYIMVTHDRYFLDKVTNCIVEIDKGNLYRYSANYKGFLKLKAEREEMLLATERKKESLYRKDLEWMMRGARARSTKQKAHIERFEALRDREKPIVGDSTVEVNTLSTRLGKKTIELSHISKGYGERQLIKDFSYIFLREDRVGIIGHNGCGKSTLLKIINGIVEPDEGTVEIGETVKIGYFSQENEYMDENQRVIDYIKDTALTIQTTDGTKSASQMCELFLFDGTLQYSYIKKLSGGEKRRLYLLKVLMEAPNILILDEPTNDLDIQTLTILEDYLSTYSGIVIAVSHDRYFLDKLATRIFAFEENGKIRQYEGNYSDYHSVAGDKKSVSGQEKEKISQPKKEKVKTSQKLKFSYLEQQEYDTIDDCIAELEEKLENLEPLIEKEASNYGKLNELMKQKEELELQLEQKMERWVYLNDLAEQIKAEKENGFVS
ncbi:ABC-F family ATP-binding cassette domain-containing protein [Velocimicrobium porci]|uniref:ABC-F family ATP-binding cassette domain-containing protein n=1 Tax=Velocimicrobium porci TaxID=2606634 RepID=A0A6L5Y2C4_9FIRM|nr:ABC-F family ATP-binding cassette domain-containing protein [Velocimicrobium porci]MSS64263.1 ABC-F family ATP-binding cassette domain-containing protein [Velocimicrobium porci]